MTFQISGLSTFGTCSNLGTSVFFTWVYAEIATLVAPILPRNFAIVSKWRTCRCHLWRWNTVLCEYCSASFFVLKMPLRSTTRSLYFVVRCKFGVHQMANPSNSRNELSFLLSSHDGRLLTLIPFSSHNTLDLSAMSSTIHSLRRWLLVFSKLLVPKLACVPNHSETFPHILLRLCVPYVVGSPSRMLLSFLNLTVPHCCTCLKFPSAVILLNARHLVSNASLPASEEHRQSPWNNPCHRSVPRGCPCHGVASSSAHSANSCSYRFLDNPVQASGHIKSGLVVFWICVGLPITHLYLSRSLVRKIWNLAVPIHSSESLTPFASIQKKNINDISRDIVFFLFWFCVPTSKYVNGGSGMIRYLCRINCNRSYSRCRYINSPRIDHESSVVLLLLSPPFDFNIIILQDITFYYGWRYYWTIKKSSKKKRYAHGHSYSPFANNSWLLNLLT